MKRILAICSFLIGLGFGSQAFSFGSGEIKLEGVVRNFTKSEVDVESQSVIYAVPRTYILLPDLKANQRIEVSLTADQFDKLKKRSPPKNQKTQ